MGIARKKSTACGQRIGATAPQALEELFETWTGGFLGEHDKPVVLLDADGFYQPMLQWLESLRGEGFVAQAALERLLVAGSVAWPVLKVRVGAALTAVERARAGDPARAGPGHRAGR